MPNWRLNIRFSVPVVTVCGSAVVGMSDWPDVSGKSLSKPSLWRSANNPSIKLNMEGAAEGRRALSVVSAGA